MTQRPQIIRLVELAEAAASTSAGPATALGALFPDADSRRGAAARRMMMQLMSFDQGGVGETLAGYIDQGSKAGDAGTDDGHVGF